ncbi:PREDICTED: glycophorin-C [Buceros rhinoceros silvestris]|nr:PREDICTED: glycophorin-C [Buceros rhinoceros silvestris]
MDKGLMERENLAWPCRSHTGDNLTAEIWQFAPAAGEIETPTAGTDAAVIGGVIAAVILVLICLLVVMVRYMYRHKGTYHTNEAKGTEFAENADAALKNDPALQEAVDESKKEYFI